MKALDELREFYQRADGYELWCPRHRRELAEIADRIEAENRKLQAKVDLLLVDSAACFDCEAMLDCDECLRADASHKELKGLKAENDELRELCHELYEFMSRADRMQWPEVICRMRRLGIEVDE